MADTAAAPAKRTNLFTTKIGPLPMWAWVAIIGSLIIVWSIYARKKTASNAQTAANAANGNQALTPPVVEQFQINTPPEQEDEGGSTAKGKGEKGEKESAADQRTEDEIKRLTGKNYEIGQPIPSLRKSPVDHHSRHKHPKPKPKMRPVDRPPHRPLPPVKAGG